MSRFGRLRTTEDVFFHRLAAALRMEVTMIDLAEQFAARTSDDEVEAFLRERAAEARRHITNVEASFRLAGKEPWERPNPPMQGLIREGEITLRRSSRDLRDIAILTSARSMIAYGAASYRALLDLSAAERNHDVAVLLQENLDELVLADDAVDELSRSLVTRRAAQYAA